MRFEFYERDMTIEEQCMHDILRDPVYTDGYKDMIIKRLDTLGFIEYIDARLSYDESYHIYKARFARAIAEEGDLIYNTRDDY